MNNGPYSRSRIRPIIHALFLFKEIKNIKILLIFIEGISDNNYTEIEEYKI